VNQTLKAAYKIYRKQVLRKLEQSKKVDEALSYSHNPFNFGEFP
jgi:hypothetical protein